MRKTAGIVAIELALAIGLTVVPMLVPVIEPTIGYMVLSACILLLAFGAMLFFWPGKAKTEMADMADDFSIKTGDISGMGHRIGHEFHGPQQRTMIKPLREQILRELPRDKIIDVIAVMGDGEAFQFANDIHAFLKSEGFQLSIPEGVSQGMFAAPIQGMIVEPNGDDKLRFIVGRA